MNCADLTIYNLFLKDFYLRISWQIIINVWLNFVHQDK